MTASDAVLLALGFHEPSSLLPLGLAPAGFDQLSEGDFNFSTNMVLSCDNFCVFSSLFGELSLKPKYLSTSSSMGSFISN